MPEDNAAAAAPASSANQNEAVNPAARISPLRRLARQTFAGRLLLLPLRFWTMSKFTLPPVAKGLAWVFRSREHYNFTYDLHPRNLKHLAGFVAQVTGCSLTDAERYIQELQDDNELREHIQTQTAVSPERFVSDKEVRYGRRLGWYALVRAKKPKFVVETGVDKGLGTVVLAAALKRNAQEGHAGRLLGLDINPVAGSLLQGSYKDFGKLLIQDSLKSLGELTESVDFFIHDSDHNPDFEAAEYNAVSSKLTPGALVLSDNAAHTDELLNFASGTGRRFLFFAERPEKHWWPGEGIGAAYRA